PFAKPAWPEYLYCSTEPDCTQEKAGQRQKNDARQVRLNKRKTPVHCTRVLEVATRFELVNEGFADLCLTTWPRHHVERGIPPVFGAADEARTRYLHLGKVALYQM